MYPGFRPEQFVGIFFWLFVAGVGLILDLIVCFFLYKIFQRVPPQYRVMEPGLVWLLIIPCFNLVWNFFVFIRLSRSLKRYFNSVGNQTVGDCGEGLGLGYSICEVARLIPCVGILVWIAALVLVILYLVKVNQLSEQIPKTA
ncbi:MAG: hypothetical protein ACM3NO_04895 [Deltaproteobacteria bacterium]